MGARGAKSAKMDGGSACATAEDMRHRRDLAARLGDNHGGLAREWGDNPRNIKLGGKMLLVSRGGFAV